MSGDELQQSPRGFPSSIVAGMCQLPPARRGHRQAPKRARSTKVPLYAARVSSAGPALRAPSNGFLRTGRRSTRPDAQAVPGSFLPCCGSLGVGPGAGNLLCPRERTASCFAPWQVCGSQPGAWPVFHADRKGGAGSRGCTSRWSGVASAGRFVVAPQSRWGVGRADKPDMQRRRLLMVGSEMASCFGVPSECMCSSRSRRINALRPAHPCECSGDWGPRGPRPDESDQRRE